MRPTDELRQLVEDLALRLVVEDPVTPGASGASSWIPALEKVRDSAAGEGAGVVATAAEGLIGTLRPADGRFPEAELLAAELQQGILRLQQSMEAGPQPSSSQENSLAQDPELLSDFVLESREHLARIETQVLTLERDPCDSEALNSIFRGFHTMKGLAGFLELWAIQKLAHEVEFVLDRARNFELKITPKAIDVVLESADHLRRWMAHLESTLQNQVSEPPRQDDALLARIRALVSADEPAEAPHPDLVALAAAVEANAAPSSEPSPTAAEETPATPAETARPGRRNETMAVKVDTAKLDYLVDMAGEMVIAETLVRHDPDLKTIKSQRLQRNVAQLMRITTELQKTAMAMRLVPIGPLFRRMARLVRDLSRQFGKQVEMHTEGDDIELDRTIVEELADPLMHMVRNSMDHGLESPQERVEKGKSALAALTLRAHHQAGQVVIEIADDGRGLDREKIVAKALQRGLITSGSGLTDNEINNLIFEPGFTTAAQVTNVSGRGVGMDVVRRHIEKLRGRVEIHSRPGAGTSFLLKLPLTLAIIDGLVVGVGQERFIVPLFAVREMFRPTEQILWTVQQRGEMALVRDTLLPVFRLYRKFNMTPRSENPCESVLIVAEAEGERFCMVVDELIGKQEVVIKSLGETFKNVEGIAGGAILGDGRVGLILDLERLFKDRNSEAIR
ncbi:CheA signal transduction histidine kinase [Candidatus Sulfopaludibacter sp. SbA3]|nr:CheA signal transduction histidine kinase [Candidatus Sulfopaludibacter sp. SbA3]